MARKRTPTARPELLSLLAACKAEPEEDAPRLVLADWLEEHGDEHDRARAEFIRLQLARAAEQAALNVAHAEGGPHRNLGLDDRQLALLREHGKAWLGRSIIAAVREVMNQPLFCFRRGFASLAATSEKLCEAIASGLVGSEAWAFVDSLSLVTEVTSSQARELARAGALSGLCGLRLDGRLTDAALRAFFRADLSCLCSMNPSHTSHADLVAKHLAAWDGLPSLRVLCLDQSNASDRGIRHLCEAGPLGLRDLSAFQCRLTAQSALLLGRAGLSHLERLDLSNNTLSEDGVRGLLDNESLGSLRELGLQSTGEGDGAVGAIAACPRLAGLERLNLGGNGITDGGARALADSPYLRRLAVLNFQGYIPDEANRIGADGLAALARSPVLASVRYLDLSDVLTVGPGGVIALAEAPAPLALRALSLRNCRIGTEGVRALAQSSSLPQLRRLDLAANGLGDEAAWLLASAPGLRLEWVCMTGNDITDEGRAALVDRYGPGLFDRSR